MRRVLLGLFLTVTIFVAPAAPAYGCLWDRELEGHEREFKSQYLEPPSVADTIVKSIPAAAPWAGGAGVAMLLVASSIGIIRARKRRE